MEPLIAKPHLIAALDAGNDVEKPRGVDAASRERRFRNKRSNGGGRTDPGDFLEDDPLDRLPRVRPRTHPIGDDRLAVCNTNASHRAHAASSHRVLPSMRVTARATTSAASHCCKIHERMPGSIGDRRNYTMPLCFCETNRDLAACAEISSCSRRFCGLPVVVTPPAVSAAQTAECHPSGTGQARLVCRSAPCRESL